VRYFRIRKDERPAPTAGGYRQWKPELAVEGLHQCVYCAIPEARFGGIHNFHVEHFRPQSRFPALESVWGNLFYSCGLCNIFKGDDWPDEAGDSAYVDPSLTDYSSLIAFNDEGFAVPQNQRAAYTIERLYLNRPQLLIERRESLILARLIAANRALAELREGLPATVGQEKAMSILERLLAAHERVTAVTARIRDTVPYGREDVRRPTQRRRE